MQTTDDTRPIRITIAGGGTGGHVLPAVAVIEELRQRDIVVDFQWIGSKSGVEREEATVRNIPYVPISTGKLRRYLDLNTVPDTLRIPIGSVQAWRALRTFKPDVVFSSGGYVSFPTVFAASRTTPVLTHEQTAILGLATRLDLKFCDVAAVSHDATLTMLDSYKGQKVVTGNPVRRSILDGSTAKCHEHFGLSSNLPLVYVTGGARGAQAINELVESVLPELLQHTQIIHQTGPASSNPGFTRMQMKRESLSPDLRDRYHVREFIREELCDIFATADLVVGRSGAGTVAELALLGKPSVLIPLPGSGGDEQIANAKVLEDVGASIAIAQSDMTQDRFVDLITTLLADQTRLKHMGDAAKSVGKPEAAANLADELLRLAGFGEQIEQSS